MLESTPGGAHRRLGWNALRTLPFLLFLLVLGNACSDSTSPKEEATVVGTWNATSFSALGTDLILDGMTLAATLQEDGTYSFAFTDDQIGACNPGPDCTSTGTYLVSGAPITLDQGTNDEVTFTYSLQGSGMTWSGSINAVPATITFSRQ